MNTWAYDLPNQDLMEALSRATVRAGISGSGLIIDLAGGSERVNAYYLYGIVLSRLDGKRPPFKPGDMVRMNPKETYYCGSVIVSGGRYESGNAKPDIEYEVSRVLYEKISRRPWEKGEDYVWTVSFKDKEIEKCHFPADRFEKVEQTQQAVA